MISNYPEAPGSKVAGPSREAAEAVASDAKRLRDECYALLRTENMTADECAERLNRSVLSVRPRFSELKAMGLIFATGGRRKNASGHSATLWTTLKPATP